MMQLDDVVHSSVTGERLEEAMYRFACEIYLVLSRIVHVPVALNIISSISCS